MKCFLKVIGLLVITYLTIAKGNKVKTKKATCPDENETVCISCDCDKVTGYNKCEALSQCPPPITSTKQAIRMKEPKDLCPYGKKFSALCALCECSGYGRDHCGLCSALPVRRHGQPEVINRKLPYITDNRFFNYEINGWKTKH